LSRFYGRTPPDMPLFSLRALAGSCASERPLCEWTPTVAEKSAKRSSKAVQILDRLRHGPATTAELCRITPAYSQRMGDLKKLGHQIEREDFVDETGEWSVYRLEWRA